MADMRRLGLLGGTFDPVHYGHLDAAEAARTALRLDEVQLMPAHDPPHRQEDPRSSAFHRFALIALAIEGRPWLRASDRELRRTGAPSYTIDTLQTLHGEGWRPSQIFFILGTDAFAEIASWRSYPQVLDAAHFVVIARPGMASNAALARVPGIASRLQPAGEYPAAAEKTSVFIVEARTRDVSSTLIRARLTARERIDDLVPATVARHILAHHLYGAVDDLHGEEQRITSQGI
jgi:nicotinate-nucleotide adenylyltransferase